MLDFSWGGINPSLWHVITPLAKGFRGSIFNGRMTYSNLPAWILAALTAVWFALMAFKLGRGTLWWIGGAVLGLSVSAICLGLTHAVALPYAPPELRRMESIGIVAAVLLIGATGAIIGLANSKSHH
jgi:hypothetical protein